MDEEDQHQSVKTESLLPILNADNYSSWYGRMKVHLRGKDLWNVCVTRLPVEPAPSSTAVTKHTKAMNEAIAIIIPRLNSRCYRECVNPLTMDDSFLLWEQIADQYASHSVINQGRVFMSYAALNYDGDLQKYIDSTRKSLIDMDTVDMTMPKKITSYFILGKLMNRDLDQVVDKTAFEPEVMTDPYNVLNALQEFQTHKKNKLIDGSRGTALVSTTSFSSSIPKNSKFPFKVIHYCANGDQNPDTTTHPEAKCFEKYPHLKQGYQSKSKGNASTSFAHALVFVTFTSHSKKEMIVVDSAASHHMVRDRSLFNTFTQEKIEIKTGNPDSRCGS
jgi:hypothetical protein